MRVAVAVLISPSELEALIRDQPEGQFLEFKSAWERSGKSPKPLARREVRDTIVKCVAAFANADGGMLLVGGSSSSRSGSRLSP